VYCDVELDTATLAVPSAAERVGPRTRAIMPVHYGGFPCRMDEILELARDRGLKVVEDAAHAFGSSYRGRPIGSMGDFTCFSFDPLKNVTCGEGGAVTTDSDEAADRIRAMRGLGIESDAWSRRASARPWFHEAVMEGFRFHLSDVNAAIGLSQLDRLDERRARKRDVVRRYQRGLRGIPGLVLLDGDVEQAYPFLCAARVLDGRRDALVRALREDGIQAWMHYVPNHLQPAFATTGADLPVTEQLYDELVSFPLYHELSDDGVDRVVAATRSFLGAGW
jgi:perosamine synthetase